MKKIVSVFLTFLFLISLMSFAGATGESWHCDTCNADRDTEFCPVCGAQKPVASSETSTWVCPTCGRELPVEYNFCPDDRTEKVLPAGKWPIRILNGVGTSLKKLASTDDRHQSYAGPDGKAYSGTGAYKPFKVSSATALFREGNYVLVDITYKTVGRRCVYFKSSSLVNDAVESVTLESVPAKVKVEIQPSYGPGAYYDELEKTITEKNKTRTDSVLLEPGTEIKVFFETNGWVFAEFNCSLGLVRAWLPAETVE